MASRHSGKSARLARRGGVLVLAGGLLFWAVSHGSDDPTPDATTGDRPMASAVSTSESNGAPAHDETNDAATSDRSPQSTVPPSMAATRLPWWKSGEGKIGNRVWYDVDRDGIQDPGERGLAGIEIRLINAANGAVLATGRSDAHGWWGYSGLADTDARGRPATYRIQFVAPPGFSPTTVNASANPAKDSDMGTNGLSVGSPLAVRANGQWLNRDDIDGGFVD